MDAFDRGPPRVWTRSPVTTESDITTYVPFKRNVSKYSAATSGSKASLLLLTPRESYFARNNGRGELSGHYCHHCHHEMVISVRKAPQRVFCLHCYRVRIVRDWNPAKVRRFWIGKATPGGTPCFPTKADVQHFLKTVLTQQPALT